MTKYPENKEQVATSPAVAGDLALHNSNSIAAHAAPTRMSKTWKAVHHFECVLRGAKTSVTVCELVIWYFLFLAMASRWASQALKYGNPFWSNGESADTAIQLTNAGHTSVSGSCLSSLIVIILLRMVIAMVWIEYQLLTTRKQKEAA